MKISAIKLQIVIACLLFPTILFLSFPPSIITGNSQDIIFYKNSLHMMWALWVGFSIIMGSILIAVNEKTSILLFQIILAFLLNILFWNTIFPYVWITTCWKLFLMLAVELTGLILCFRLLRILPLPLILRTTTIFMFISLLFAAKQNYSLNKYLSYQPISTNTGKITTTIYDSKKFKGNVYHIVLDAFSSSYVISIPQNKIAQELDGYTFYPNATSNYGRTELSMRSVFNGSFHEGNIDKWDNAFQNGFADNLKKANVGLYYYPFYSYFCHSGAKSCRGTLELAYAYKKNYAKSFLIDILFQRILPASLRSVMMGSLKNDHRNTSSWDYGFSITNWFTSLYQDNIHFPKWLQPIQSFTMDTLDDFLKNESQQAPSGRYVYLHIMAPHGPFAFSVDCDFEEPKLQNKKSEAKAIQDQFACTMKLIKKITNALKSANHFNNSLVIFHADHGLGYTNIKKIPKAVYRDIKVLDQLTNIQISALANVLLLVHTPGQSNFQISTKEHQLIDIAPTIS